MAYSHSTEVASHLKGSPVQLAMLQLLDHEYPEEDENSDLSASLNIQTPSGSNPPTSDKAANALHVLVVENNVIILKVLLRYLAKSKLNTVVTACNGRQAVNAVRDAEAGKKFDVIFMDISMPGTDGFEATRSIRNLECNSPHHFAYDLEVAVVHEGEDEAEDSGYRIGRRLGKNQAYVVALTELINQRDQDEAEKNGFDDFWTKPISFRKARDLLKKLNTEKSLVNEEFKS